MTPPPWQKDQINYIKRLEGIINTERKTISLYRKQNKELKNELAEMKKKFKEGKQNDTFKRCNRWNKTSLTKQQE